MSVPVNMTSLPIQSSAVIECAQSNDYLFPGSSEGDVLFYPANYDQKIHVGAGWYKYPAITVDGKNVGINRMNPETTLHVGGNAIIENGGIQFISTSNYNMNQQAMSFVNAQGQQVGSVLFGSSGTIYNTISDYRLKTVMGTVSGALEQICKIPVYKYQYNGDHQVQTGCLAHDIQTIAPWAVTGEKDGAEHQAVDYSKLVPLLISAIQDLAKTKID